MRALAVHLLFFLSGISGLVYQVVWVRLFGNVFGNSVHSAATVSGVFLFGLGLGGYAVGRWIDRRGARAALHTYGIFELLIAALGLGIAWTLPLLEPLSAAIASYGRGAEGWYELSLATHLLRHGAALVLLAPITFLMGGTLTLLIRHRVTRHLAETGWRVGALYGINTLGAACGAFLTDFALIPQLGIFRTELVAVALNAAAGVGALVVAGRKGTARAAAHESSPSPQAQPHDPFGPRRALYTGVALFCSGLTAMGLQLVWFRYLTGVVGNVRAVFSLLLTVILLGIWLGSMLGGTLERRFGRPALLYLAVQTLLVATSLGTLAAFSQVDLGVHGELTSRWTAASGVGRAVVETWLTLRPILWVVGVPALLMGFAYPLANAHVQRVEGRVGSRAGGLYLFNTLGNLVGSLWTGFFLLPVLGIQNATAVLAAVGALGLVSLYASQGERRAASRPAFAGAALSLATVLGAWALLPPGRLLAPSVPAAFADGQRVLSVSEGVQETVAVLELPGVERRLFTNGHSMSSTHPLAQRYMRLFAHVPLLQMEAPRDVLVICFGVGNTLHAASLHPSVERIEAVDLSRNVVRHAGWFRQSNRDAVADPRVSVFINDGRQHLRMQPPERYDLITLEPPPINAAGVAALYSSEFYELARSRLREGGALTQWLPAYQVSADAVRSILRAFLDVFPGGVMLSGYRSEFILLGARDGAPLFDLPAVHARLGRRAAVRRDLRRIEVDSLTSLVGTFVADGDTLERAAAGVVPVSDDWPVMEYSVRAAIYETALPERLIDVSRVADWCPACFEGDTPHEKVSDLPGYLSALARWYDSDAFRHHASLDSERNAPLAPEPITAPAAIEAIRRSPYLRRVLGGAGFDLLTSQPGGSSG